MTINAQLMREFKKTKTSEYVDVIGLFCNAQGCLTHTGDDLRTSITSWDYGHLTPSASRYLSKKLLVERIVREDTTTVGGTGGAPANVGVR
jgi:hypothetical protein